MAGVRDYWRVARVLQRQRGARGEKDRTGSRRVPKGGGRGGKKDAEADGTIPEVGRGGLRGDEKTAEEAAKQKFYPAGAPSGRWKIEGKNEERKFGEKGMLKLTVHDASPGKRRMTGTIVGTKLEGEDELSGKFIDVTASFDMDFSCGVK
jgi:hypothetical protein